MEGQQALCGEWVQLVVTEHLVLVYYFATLFRELNLRTPPHPCVKDV